MRRNKSEFTWIVSFAGTYFACIHVQKWGNLGLAICLHLSWNNIHMIWQAFFKKRRWKLLHLRLSGTIPSVRHVYCPRRPVRRQLLSFCLSSLDWHKLTSIGYIIHLIKETLDLISTKFVSWLKLYRKSTQCLLLISQSE